MKKFLALIVFVYFLIGSAEAAEKRYSTECKVFFMEEIDHENMKLLLRDVAQTTACEENSQPLPELIIQSGGGTVETAILVYGEIKDTVCTTVQQSASSAAVLLVLSGKKGCRKMHRDGFLMFHQITFPGEEEIRPGTEVEASGLSVEETGVKKRVIERYASIVSTNSALTPAQVKEFMQKVTFISAQDAKKYGLIDIIFE